MQSTSVFLDIPKLLISNEKMLMSAKLKAVSRDLHVFGFPLGKLKLVPSKSTKFHHCRICVTEFRDGSLFAPPSMSSPKKVHPE